MTILTRLLVSKLPKVSKVRRVVLDVDIPSRISIVDLANEILKVPGVKAVNITVEETDVDVLGLVVIVEGDNIDFEELKKVIENHGAAIHGVDQIAVGDYIIEYPVRPTRR